MSNYQILVKLKGYRALSCEGNILYLYKKNSIYEYDISSNKIKFFNELPFEGKNFKKLLFNSRLISRILRLHPTASIIFNKFLYIAFGPIIYRVDLKTKKCFIDFKIPANRKILNFSTIKDFHGESLVFGKYFSNPNKNSVNIWCRSEGSGAWQVLYVFPDGAINHVHNISQVDARVLVLTGDFGGASAIWSFDFAFSEYILIGSGSQIFRATWISHVDGIFYYATDSQLEQNYLICSITSIGGIQTHKISKLPGSSIYAGMPLDSTKLLFSTSVECGEPSSNAFVDLFSCRRGPGISSNNSYIYEYDLVSRQLLEVFSLEKDLLPFRLFQFGSFIFPSGVMPDNIVIAYCNALKRCDDCTLIFKK